MVELWFDVQLCLLSLRRKVYTYVAWVETTCSATTISLLQVDSQTPIPSRHTTVASLPGDSHFTPCSRKSPPAQTAKCGPAPCVVLPTQKTPFTRRTGQSWSVFVVQSIKSALPDCLAGFGKLSPAKIGCSCHKVTRRNIVWHHSQSLDRSQQCQPKPTCLKAPETFHNCSSY